MLKTFAEMLQNIFVFALLPPPA